MNLNLFHRVTALIVAFVSVSAVMSCVQQEYEISEENLNLEVTLFQDGAQVPLGTTGEMNMKNLMEAFGHSEVAEHLNSIGENGEYFYEMSENLDLSECLTESGEFTSEPVVRYMDLSTVRETMNFGSSDAALNNARLCVDFDTNIGQASAADLTITPYYGGVPSESVTRRLEIQPSMSMEQMTKTKYWLGSNRDVASEDYIFVDFPIQDILKELPDMIKISMTAVNVKNGKSMGVTKAEIPADYRLEANCRFEVPLVFDETSQVTFSYTIENLQKVLTEVFATGNLIFTGTVINSFPLNITMNGELLDSAGKTIAVNGANMVIPAGSVDNPVTTNIDFSFNNADLGTDKDISGVRLNFTATGVNGAAITSESTLEVSLQAYVPNGLPINLKDLLNVQK
jgi:hypothetical protein